MNIMFKTFKTEEFRRAGRFYKREIRNNYKYFLIAISSPPCLQELRCPGIKSRRCWSDKKKQVAHRIAPQRGQSPTRWGVGGTEPPPVKTGSAISILPQRVPIDFNIKDLQITFDLVDDADIPPQRFSQVVQRNPLIGCGRHDYLGNERRAVLNLSTLLTENLNHLLSLLTVSKNSRLSQLRHPAKRS